MSENVDWWTLLWQVPRANNWNVTDENISAEKIVEL